MSTATLDILLQVRSDLAQLTQASHQLQALGRDLRDLTSRAAESAKSATGLGQAFAGGAGMAAAQAVIAGTVAKVKELIGATITYNANIEQQTLAFKTLLGSMDAAKDRMASISSFAAATPFELPEVVEANRILQTLTHGALATEDGMRLVGDAASAAGRSFQETAMWIGRLYAGLQSGTPIGEATMRLIEMGLISGETARQLGDLATSGAQGARTMGLMRDTFAGTAGAMREQSVSFNGMVSTLKDTLAQLGGEYGKPLFLTISATLRDILEALGALPSKAQEAHDKVDEALKSIRTRVNSMSSVADIAPTKEAIRKQLAEAEKIVEEWNAKARKSGRSIQPPAEIEEQWRFVQRLREELVKFGEPVPFSTTEKQIEARLAELEARANAIVTRTKTVKAPIGNSSRTHDVEVPYQAPQGLSQAEAAEKAELERRLGVLRQKTAKEIADANEANKPKWTDSPGVVQARIEGARKVAAIERQVEEEQTRQKYEDHLITLGEYLDRKREMAVEAVHSEIAASYRIETNLLKEQNLAKTQDERNKLQESIEQQRQLRKAAQAQLQSDLAKIDRDGAEERRRLDREALGRSLEQAKQESERKLAQIEVEKARSQNDFTSTDAEKRQRSIELLGREYAELRRYIDLLKERRAVEAAKPGADQGAISQYDSQIDSAEGKARGVNAQAQGLGAQADINSYADQFRAVETQIENEWGSFSQQLATSFHGVFDGAISTISSGLTDIIMQGRSVGQVFQQIGMTILTSVVQAIIQMGIRWIATRILMAVMGKSIMAASAAATAPIAAAATATWATPATLATIATYGSAAEVAPALILGAEAETLAGSAMSGFADGGYTGNIPRNQVAGPVHGQEFVLNADATAALPRPVLEELNRGNMPVVQHYLSGNSGSQAAPTTINQDFALFVDPRDLQNHMNDHIDSRVIRVLERAGINLSA